MPGLDLRGAAIVDKGDVEAIPTGDEMVDKIHQRMRDMNIPEIQAPKCDPPPTLAETDTTELSMRELEVLYAKYVSYGEFINPIVEARSAALRAEKSRLKLVKARVTKMLRKDGIAKSDIVAMRDAHEQVEEVASSILFIESERDIIQATAKVYTNEAKALSRIVEMRKLDFEQSNRGENLSKGTKSSRRFSRRKFKSVDND